MKKILFMAMAAAAMVGCSQNEEFENAGQQAEIQFGTAVSTTTRAAVTDLAELQKSGVGFTVYGYNTGSSEMTAVTAAADMKAFMNATANFADSKWTLSGSPYYWPMTDNIQFFAYGNPGSATLNYVAPAAVVYPAITYTVAEVAAQTDFVVASVLNANKTDNVNGVSLAFTHALTQINFTIKTADALTYTLKTLSISGVNNTGTYNFGTGKWENQTGTATYAHTIASEGLAVNESGVTENVAWMLMPQTLPADAKINVTYDIHDNGVLLDQITSNIDLNATTAWGEGKKLRYTLTLANKAAQVSFEPSVGNWKENGDDDTVDKGN